MSLLPVSKVILESHTAPKNFRLLILQHGLRDTAEFMRLAQRSGFSIGTFIAKPNSVDVDVVKSIEKSGVNVICEPYSILENTDVLDKLLVSETEIAYQCGQMVLIVDVGGYFCQPLLNAARETTDLIKGVVEVTTFGDNRYQAKARQMSVPVMSIAKSPLKEAEAGHVGETVVQATEDILRDCGLILSGKQYGVIGYGMIGSRIAAALQKRNNNVCMVDHKKSLMLQAKLANIECVDFRKMLESCDIIFSATATQSISQ